MVSSHKKSQEHVGKHESTASNTVLKPYDGCSSGGWLRNSETELIGAVSHYKNNRASTIRLVVQDSFHPQNPQYDNSNLLKGHLQDVV